MLKIENHFIRKDCPLCCAEKIYKLGDIEYLLPVYFSSIEISINLKPELWKCSNCHARFVQNAISEQSAIALYMNGSSTERWSNSKFEDSKGEEIVNALSNLFYKDARVLDVGCNTGELLDFAKAKGCKTFGIEYSLNSIDSLKQKGHTVLSSLSENNNYYDVITAFDLVEHLYNLPEFIKNCYSQLVKNGYLVILTGNILSLSSVLTGSKWWYVSFPEHIVFPSKHYFNLYSNFKLQSWLYTYASRSYKYSLPITLKQIIKKVVTKTYNGLPSIGGDHVLIILKK